MNPQKVDKKKYLKPIWVLLIVVLLILVMSALKCEMAPPAH
ncbi:MAG: hypothetical protein ACYS1A_04350 [Planctomycetota bacterium]|jgi:hypothetical protein